MCGSRLTRINWGHANVIRFCKRPWLREGDVHINDQGQEAWVSKSVSAQRCEEMDEAMIANWNDVVGKGDVVYHAGDFAFCNNTQALMRYFRRLNGSIHLIYGNHDRPKLLRDVPFAWQGDRKKIKVDGQAIIIDHYAGRVWDKMHRGSWQLYGHSHGSLPDDKTTKSFDIGVDCHDFKPISFEEVREKMKEYSFTPVDHHG